MVGSDCRVGSEDWFKAVTQVERDYAGLCTGCAGAGASDTEMQSVCQRSMQDVWVTGGWADTWYGSSLREPLVAVFG
jgi:hypothetical protein